MSRALGWASFVLAAGSGAGVALDAARIIVIALLGAALVVGIVGEAIARRSGNPPRP
jgi:uncharacterized membrane protein YjjB (DUF3815 family)